MAEEKELSLEVLLRERARIDAELDAKEAERQADTPSGPASAEPQDDQQPLWWEKDPRFTTRFKPSR